MLAVVGNAGTQTIWMQNTTCNQLLFFSHTSWENVAKKNLFDGCLSLLDRIFNVKVSGGIAHCTSEGDSFVEKPFTVPPEK